VKFQILSGQEIIGETELEILDPGMNVYSGPFLATLAYTRIRLIFKLFSDALDRTDEAARVQLEEYYRKRDKLELTIRGQDGRQLCANWIHIVDLQEDLEDLVVEVALAETLAREPGGA